MLTPSDEPVIAACPGGSTAMSPSLYEKLDYRRWSPLQQVVRCSMRAALHLAASLTFEGAHQLDSSDSYILAANHLAIIDGPLVMVSVPRPIIPLVAAKFRQHRVPNWYLSTVCNAIFVEKGVGDHDVIKAGLAVLRSGGRLGLGPEGRISRTGALEQGHFGIAYLAAEGQVPVIPMAMWGQEEMWNRLRRGRRSPIRIRFGEPIAPPPAEAPRAELSAFVDSVMAGIAALLPERYRGVYAGTVAPGIPEGGERPSEPTPRSADLR